MLSQIARLLTVTAFGLVIYALLLRFHMQWLRHRSAIRWGSLSPL